MSTTIEGFHGGPRKRRRSYAPGDPRHYCGFPGCDLSFSRLEHLKRHFKIHETNERPQCKFCNRSFARQDILTRHVRRKHAGMGDFGLGPDGSSDHDPRSNTVDRSSHSPGMQESVYGRDTTADSEDESGAPKESEVKPHSSSNIFDVLNSIELKEDHAAVHAVHGTQEQERGRQFFNEAIEVAAAGATNSALNELESPLQNTENLWSSNQALSHLKNEDFLDWLFNQSNMALENGTGYSSDDGGNSDTAILMASGNDMSPDFNSTTNSVEYLADFCTQETCERLKSIIPAGGGSLNKERLDGILTPENVTHAISRYWLLHNRWPLLHKPTFRVNECPPHLLMSMITLAMFIGGDPEGIYFSTEVHETHRYSIYMLPQFSMPSLWVFQALLLSEIFELLASTEKQHDLASRFHSVMISTMRKAGPMDSDFLHNMSKDQLRSEEEILDFEWKTFIDQEARRRVAFFAFVLDTQHSTFFNQPASMFISDMNLRLPCEEEVWEAADARSWKELKRSNPSPPLFTKVIGSFLKLEFDSRVQLSPWSMMIVLHGLISAGWNMRLKERISLEPNSTTGATIAAATSADLPIRTPTPSQSETWTHIISKAYHFWLRHYKFTFINSGRLSHNHPYVLGCLATYETAHIFMNCPLERFMHFLEFVALNTNAARHHQGPVEVTGQIKMCAISISNWINKSTVLSDLSHALDLIDMFLLTGQPYDIKAETAFHKPWCLYLAAITVWIYQYFVMVLPPDIETRIPTLPIYSATQFIGKMRAQNSIAANSPRPKLLPDFLVTTQKRVGYCEANPLLLEILKLLEGTKWGVLKRKLEVIRIILCDQ